MFRISWKQDYGMQFLSLLSISHGKRLISLSQAAKTLSISPLYLKKVAADLRKSGLVASKEGVTGGYSLSRSPKEISMFEILEALSGQKQMTQCLEAEGLCPMEKFCIPKNAWKRVNAIIKKSFSQISLGEIV